MNIFPMSSNQLQSLQQRPFNRPVSEPAVQPKVVSQPTFQPAYAPVEAVPQLVDHAEVTDLQQQVLARVNQGKLPVTPQNRNNMEPMISEVADIAQKSGFVGLSTQDVLRAYAYGTSLLADYSV